MEGLYFEAKPRGDEAPAPRSSNKPRPSLRSNPHSCPALSHLMSASQSPRVCVRGRTATWAARIEEETEEEVRYKLTVIGSRPVHHLTTMAMLPWVVAEIGRCQRVGKDAGVGVRFGGEQLGLAAHNQTVFLCVSVSWVRCVSAPQEGVLWDPLRHTVLFECRPHQVTKLIHNSQKPSSFACLVRGMANCACFVFQCQDSTKVPEIISTLRQAGKTSARNSDLVTVSNQTSISSGGDCSEIWVSSLSTTAASVEHTAAVSPTTFAKKFEVLFCGRVSVAHKKAPPALIDECIEKFGQLHGAGTSDKGGHGGGLVSGLRRALNFQSNGLGSSAVSNGTATSPATAKRPVLFKKDPSFPSLQALDENGLSPEISNTNTINPLTHSAEVQPTNLQENRTMLFTVGKSQIFLVSPDTKKVVIEKSFKEISFCSQGIHHVDHFGFICREMGESGNCHFVCYVFQCTDESLVDEIMLTLKQAFSVAALQQTKTQTQQCDSCPMQQLHRLCERIEGLHPSKTKLELQRHLASLNNEEQASIFENTMRARPKNDQEENELVMASLRNLYEERQKSHQHTLPVDNKRVCEDVPSAPAEAQTQSSSRLEQFKTRAKRSLTESLEGIWKGSNKGRAQRENSEGSESSSSVCTVNSSQDQPCLDDLLSASSLRPTSPLNDVAALSTPSWEGDSPLRSHHHSWRQQIFLRVATPQKSSDSIELGDPCHVVGQVVGGGGDSSMKVVPEEKPKRSREELRELWRKAILQQILLQRMERENQKLQASESDLQNKRLKLDYEEITPCLKEVTLVWEKMLGTPGRTKVKFDPEAIHTAVAQGVPRQHRGEIWKFLAEQYRLRQTVPSRPPSNPTAYKELLKQLTSQQHAILIDLGRTFPTHPYFQAQLGAGQLSLYNILKAYSLLDPEVGYCQGLSFIAGVLLLHMGEEDAFNMLKFLMYEVGLRKQYRPDMIILQIQMYQLSRLLHDYHRDLYSHLEQQEIGPSLYATPWFLTAFASHFPLGFVARVFDMLFLQGSEVIFKVALSLMGSHKPLILQHESLESIVDFIKTTLPNLGLVQMEKTINQVCEMDVSKQLQAYEVEYHVLQDELLDTSPNLNQHQRAAQLERTNQSLRQQNLDLLEELQVSHARVCSLESRVEALAQSEGQLKEQVSALEEEKQQLASTVTCLQDLLTSLGIHIGPDGHTLPPPSEKYTVTAAS
ncbi:TBC1 domain family member 1 isoform 3-T4 [Pholidichthys leucotaenia]